jgi:hypothetical protein
MPSAKDQIPNAKDQRPKVLKPKISLPSSNQSKYLLILTLLYLVAACIKSLGAFF